MAYTLGDIRTRIMVDKLDDTGYDSGVITRFLNDTQRDIANTYELPCFERVFSGLLPESASVFVFPSDYQTAQLLILVDEDNQTTDLTDRYIPFRDFFARFPIPENNTAGRPSAWTLYGGKLYIDRPTDQNYTLRLFYLKTPDLLSDASNVPELPDYFEEALVLGAYARALERNEDFDLAAVVRTQYTDLLDKMPMKLGKRQSGATLQMGNPGRMGRRLQARS